MPRSPPSSQTVTTASGSTSEASGSVSEAAKVSSTLHEDNHESDVDEDDDDDEKVLETGHNGRWQKINHQVSCHVMSCHVISTCNSGCYTYNNE